MAFDMNKIGVKQNIPRVNFNEYTGIIVCPPKFGKTTMASLFPKAIIVPFEKGFNAQVVNYVDGMNSWEDFIGFVDKLEKNRKDIGDELLTLVLDTANEAYEMCLPYMLKKEGLKAGQKYTSLADMPFGSGYAKLDQYFKTQIDRIQKLGFSILFISHSKVKNIKPKNGEAYDTYSSTMPDRLERLVYPLVDYIIFGEKRKVVDTALGTSSMKRAMIVTGANDDTQAGGRVALKGDIVFDTEEEAVALFQKHFEDAIEEKIRKAGITKSMADISKEQKTEKELEVDNYIKTQSEPTKEEMLEEIKALFPKAKDEAKIAMQKFMADNNVAGLGNPEAVDIEVVKTIRDILA